MNLTWRPNTVIPVHDTCAFVLWTGGDRVHTATWLENRWTTSAGYTVYGMKDVWAWAEQPTVEQVRASVEGGL